MLPEYEKPVALRSFKIRWHKNTAQDGSWYELGAAKLIEPSSRVAGRLMIQALI